MSDVANRFDKPAWGDTEDAPDLRASVDHAASLTASLDGLTSFQRQAVEYPAKPLLILAGAGTGKTKCLVSRVAHKIASRERLPSQILCVTFTRKAAGEMKKRLSRMLGATAQAMDVGTFHATSAKILRAHAEEAKLDPHFSVIDDDDQRKIVRQILKAQQEARKAADPASFTPEKTDPDPVLTEIERYKNAVCIAGGPWVTVDRPNCFIEYQKILDEAGLLDFTDIITRTIDLLRDDDSVREWRQQTWPAILVDEYQDTSAVQELWLDLLSPPDGTRDLTVVGDDDQSIYGFRQADTHNILGFAEKRAGAGIIRLEENFRSGSEILEYANRIISFNIERHGKTLYTRNKLSDAVHLNDGCEGFETEYDEADFIVQQILKERKAGTPLSEIAVISRTGMPLVPIQPRLTAARIPFTVTVGRRFNETHEIKAILACIRAAINTADNVAFRAALESRPRGFGQASAKKLFSSADASGSSFRTAAEVLVAAERAKNDGETPKKLEGLATLLVFLDELADDFNLGLSLAELVDHAAAESGIDREIEKKKEEANAAKDESLRRKIGREADRMQQRLSALRTAAEQAEDPHEFLDQMSLSEAESATLDPEAVWLGTIHAAKGLEFQRVFLPAWELGIFPREGGTRNTPGDEEERRLAYVALTRAKRSVDITYVLEPRSFSRMSEPPTPSPFISMLWGDDFDPPEIKASLLTGPINPSTPGRTPTRPVSVHNHQ